MIYFLQRQDKRIKIGTTEHYYSRLLSLEQRYGELKLLGFMVGHYPHEQDLHNKFKHIRAESDGIEWFLPTEELTDFIRDNAQKPDAAELEKSLPPSRFLTLRVNETTKDRIHEIAYRRQLSMDQVVTLLLDSFDEEKYPYVARQLITSEPKPPKEKRVRYPKAKSKVEIKPIEVKMPSGNRIWKASSDDEMREIFMNTRRVLTDEDTQPIVIPEGWPYNVKALVPK